MMALWFTLVTWIFAQLSAGSPQNSALASALPAITGPSGGGASTQCGPCFVVADVAGVVFGSEVINQTVATEVVSIVSGRNGTRTTTTITSIVEGITAFSFGPTGLLGDTVTGLGATTYDLSSVYMYSGLTLTSPTAYNVFTAYSVTSTTLMDGQCVVVPGPPKQISPLSYAVPTGAGRADFAISAEKAFIQTVGLPTCIPGGENPTQQTIQPRQNITTSTTVFATFSLTPQPQRMSTTGVTSTETSVAASPTNSPIGSIVPTGVTLGPGSVVSGTLTTATAIQTVVIVENSSTTTATISSAIPVVIAANSTYPLPNGLGPNETIVPFAIGRGTTLSGDLGSSWVLWGSGVFGIILATWIL